MATRRLWHVGLVVMSVLVLVLGNVMVSAREAFQNVGGSERWTCETCGAVLTHCNSNLAEPLSLTLLSEGDQGLHRWVYGRRPEKLTVFNPFHWAGLFQRGRVWPLDEAAYARLDARAEPLIQSYGSTLVTRMKAKKESPPPPLDGSLVP